MAHAPRTVPTASLEPCSHHDALLIPHWKEAMEAWHLVEPRPGINLIDSKCPFKVKRNANSSITRYNAQLVAKGFKQQLMRILSTRLSSL
jgi:hypothetical protein